MERREVLNRLSTQEEERTLLSRVWDKYDQCAGRSAPTHTAFLSPQQQAAAEKLLHILGAGADEFCFFGGYDGAERRQLHFLPPWAETADEQSVRALQCLWYSGDTLSHRDLLGSLLGLGLTRESVGDILVDMNTHSAAVLLTDTAERCALEQWDKAGRVALRVQAMALTDIVPPPKAVREVRDTVSSLRLDNVTAAAFSLSRGKASDAVEAGRVRLNGAVCLKGDRPVACGDELSVRGLGKCRIDSVGAPNRKGRCPVVIQRYI